MSDISAADNSSVNWRRRILYPVIGLVWLIVISMPLLAFILAANSELRLGDQDGAHIRLFLLQESDAQGVGAEWTSPFTDRSGCANSHVRYLLWEGTGINADYCRCVDQETGEIQTTGLKCQDRSQDNTGENLDE